MALTELSAPDFNNAPQIIGGVRVVPNLQGYWANTETNKDPVKNVSVDAPVFGRTARWEMPKRGIHTGVQVLIQLALTTVKGTGAIALKQEGLKAIVDRLAYKTNGTDVSAASGIGWDLLQFIDYPDLDLSTLDGDTLNTAVDGTYNVTIPIFIPISKDQRSDVGGILAESDGTQIEMFCSFAALQDVFTLTGTANVTATATVQYELTFRELQRSYINGQPVLYVPDLSRVHMITETTRDIVSSGPEESPQLRANGNLHRVVGWLRKSGANVDPRTLDFIKFGYGLNQWPRQHYPAAQKLFEDALHYGRPLPHNAWAFDFDAENPVRDATRPRSVSHMVMQVGIPAAQATPVKFHALQQTLISAQGSTAVVVPGA